MREIKGVLLSEYLILLQESGQSLKDSLNSFEISEAKDPSFEEDIDVGSTVPPHFVQRNSNCAVTGLVLKNVWF
jgi:hypothetical protein